MRVQAGLREEDWLHWGDRTTFKRNAAELLSRGLRPGQTIYCSPLTDPYQPAEADQRLMPGILKALARSENPPRVFVIQSRGPLILRDIDLLIEAARRTTLRVSFSITTDRDDVRRIFEPSCAPIHERWRTLRELRAAGIEAFATLAPILPCDPEALAGCALDATSGCIIADPFHVRAVKRSGATTRAAAAQICHRYGWDEWLDPDFQRSVLARLETQARRAGRDFGSGPAGFARLAAPV